MVTSPSFFDPDSNVVEQLSMPCKICGEICSCILEPRAAQETLVSRDENLVRQEQSGVTESKTESGSDVFGESVTETPVTSTAWRDEVAARLSRYQSRRKSRPPRYPSLRLPFENVVPAREDPGSRGSFVQPSHHALALNSVFEENDDRGRLPEVPAKSLDSADLVRSVAAEPALYQPGILTLQAATVTAKIIEFPRPWTPPSPPPDQLAEPVIAHPRILDVPDVIPPPPALGGITIEAHVQPEIERRPGIDYPLQGSSLGRRLSAAAIDGVMTFAASFVFAGVFWKVTALRPPRLQIAEMTGAFTILFWACYQYLLIVYAGTTPGLRLMRLTLSRFDGNPANMRLRRWRVLASFLSAVSIGMGYLWMFLDEDALCWHDRITHTYLAASGKGTPASCRE